eukprot:g6708.t1
MRESIQVGFPWSSFSDPVGAATIRAFALWYNYVIHAKKEEEFLRAFSISVWAESIDAATDSGMKVIVERAGLGWDVAKTHLQVNNGLGNDNWRDYESQNQKEMLSLGLWGVPSFAYGRDNVFWGQDRIRALEDSIVEDVCGDTNRVPDTPRM